jgi:hypothetical protein
MSSPASGTNFAALCDHARFRTGSGLAIVVSDFLTDSDWRAGVQALRATGQEVSLVQVLAPEELDPTIRGDWALVDVETGATVELTVSPRLLRRYQDELAAHTAALQDFARHHGVGFVQLSSDAPIGDVALKALQSAGVVR